MISTRHVRPLIRLLVATAALLLGCSFASLLGSSPTSTPTAEPTIPTPAPTIPTAVPSATVETSETSCLVGVWEAHDVQQFVASILPASITELGTPEFKSTAGSLRYTFTQDGQASAEAGQYAIHYAVSRGILSVPLDVLLDGKITGSYSTIAPDGLIFTATSASQITISASLAGVPVLNSSLGDLVPLFGGLSGGSAQGTYACSGSTFDYTPPISGAKPLVFSRTNP